MKTISAAYNKNDSIYISAYGHEENSADAHWGKGSRDATILHYVLSGEGFFNGMHVKEGEGFFIAANSVHEYHSSKDKPWTYFWVILGGERANETCHKFITTDENGIFTYNFKDNILDFANNIFGEKGTLSPTKAMGYFLLLMSMHETKQQVIANKYVADAKQYMKLNFHRSITICEIADFLNISDRYLYNLFIEHEGIAPKKYLNNLRIDRACIMLKAGNYSITEIAVSIGFGDVLTFSRFFKKNTNMSPSDYKKNYIPKTHYN